MRRRDRRRGEFRGVTSICTLLASRRGLPAVGADADQAGYALSSHRKGALYGLYAFNFDGASVLSYIGEPRLYGLTLQYKY